MATGGLYGNASESVGLYGNTTNFGGSYFEWFIFYQSDTQPATPTGGSWSFTTNTGTAPTGWSVVPFPAPTLPVWVSIALVNSRSDLPLVWSAPGLFSYSSGLPILSGSGTPAVGDGINSQLYVQTSTTPQTIWFKQSGTWNRLVGSTLYADLTSAQTVAGIKTFSSPIVGSVTGTSANVTGIVDIANGGTSSTTANGAFNALAPSQTSQAGKYLTTDGTNASWGTNPLGTVTSVDVSGGTTGLTTSGGPVTTSGTITLAGTLAVANGGTGATTTGVALTNLGAVGTIASADASIVVTRVGSSVDLSVSTTSPASVLLEQVRNTTGATLTKGTAVYISGATGQIPTVSKALATSDATSAQTLGLITSNLANNSNGYVTIIGLISDLDTSAYTDGQQLYLSPITAGTLTATKPYAPQHLVYMAVVAHAHPTQGKLLVKVQNGYELDELHNVAAQSPTTGQTIVWNSATSLWEKNTVSLTVGVNGTLPILNGGTGQTTANGAFNALAPSQTGNSGKYLTTDGSNTSWGTNPLGTVTSVAATVPSFLSIAGSPITTSGTLAISLSGTALPITSGGTGLTTTPANGALDIGNGTGFTRTTLTAGSGVTITNASGSITINATGTGGTVTSVSGTGVVNGLTLTGTVTTSGSLTLGGTLSLVSPPPIGSTTPSTGNFTTLTENSVAVVTQSDIGSAPNEIPLNQYLGSLAYQNGDAYFNTGMTVGFRNRIINGAMVIDQRNAGASVTPANGDYTLDRFWYNSTQASKATIQQSSTAPVGFVNSLLVTSTSAYSIATGDVFGVVQRIEGNNIADLGFGTASASTITFSFWVRSSLTGAFGGSLYNSAGNRCYPFNYTINNANTWEQKTVTVAGDTTGTWLTNNGTGITLYFCLGTGSTYGGTANEWTGSTKLGVTGQTSLVGTSGATFYITGVQLEKGNIATSFDVRPYGTELALCQRYFERNNTKFWVNGTYAAGSYTGTGINTVYFKTEKRTAPTMTMNGYTDIDNTSSAVIYPTGAISTTQSFMAVLGISAGGYPYAAAIIDTSASAEL